MRLVTDAQHAPERLTRPGPHPTSIRQARPDRSAAVVTAAALHPDDAVSLTALVDSGLAGAVHRWTHHLFLDDGPKAQAAGEQLLATGWAVSVLAPLPEPFPGWQVRVYRDVVIDEAALVAARAELTAAASRLHGSYAGWDALPVPRFSLT